MKKGILGRKIGMTEKFTTDGKVIPVTVVEVEPNVIMQVKTVENDGYNAIQLAIVDKKEKNASKAAIGHAKKAGVSPKRFLKEIRVESTEGYTLGSTIAADTFEVGEKVDVTGTSKGKGFQGVIRRHGQSRGPETHGSRYHRRPGSMGTMRPMRVLKGKKLAGHMGSETVTIQNLEIIEVCVEDNYILVSGNIPGPKNSLVLIRSAVKGGKVEPKEIIINKPETVVDTVEEVVEEKAVEVEGQTEEVAATEDATETTEEVTEEVTETNETVEESTEE
ncbi:MAG: 50S ribosomal protein L3 [Bacilli bacterium]|nr:50S ribosomal protein L3 [Bacilli bacterium]